MYSCWKPWIYLLARIWTSRLKPGTFVLLFLSLFFPLFFFRNLFQEMGKTKLPFHSLPLIKSLCGLRQFSISCSPASLGTCWEMEDWPEGRMSSVVKWGQWLSTHSLFRFFRDCGSWCKETTPGWDSALLWRFSYKLILLGIIHSVLLGHVSLFAVYSLCFCWIHSLWGVEGGFTWGSMQGREGERLYIFILWWAFV